MGLIYAVHLKFYFILLHLLLEENANYIYIYTPRIDLAVGYCYLHWILNNRKLTIVNKTKMKYFFVCKSFVSFLKQIGKNRLNTWNFYNNHIFWPRTYLKTRRLKSWARENKFSVVEPKLCRGIPTPSFLHFYSGAL